MIRRSFLKAIGAVAAGLVAPFKARAARHFAEYQPPVSWRPYPAGSDLRQFTLNGWDVIEAILPTDRWGQRLIVWDAGPYYPTVSHYAKPRVNPAAPGLLPIEADYPTVRAFVRQEFVRLFGPYRTWRGPKEFDAVARRDPRFKPWRGQRSDEEAKELVARINARRAYLTTPTPHLREQ